MAVGLTYFGIRPIFEISIKDLNNVNTTQKYKIWRFDMIRLRIVRNTVVNILKWCAWLNRKQSKLKHNQSFWTPIFACEHVFCHLVTPTIIFLCNFKNKWFFSSNFNRKIYFWKNNQFRKINLRNKKNEFETD